MGADKTNESQFIAVIKFFFNFVRQCITAVVHANAMNAQRSFLSIAFLV